MKWNLMTPSHGLCNPSDPLVTVPFFCFFTGCTHPLPKGDILEYPQPHTQLKFGVSGIDSITSEMPLLDLELYEL